MRSVYFGVGYRHGPCRVVEVIQSECHMFPSRELKMPVELFKYGGSQSSHCSHSNHGFRYADSLIPASKY